MSRTITTFAAMLSLFAFTSLASANLITNGSFEDPDLANGGAAAAVPTGWLGNSFLLDNDTTQDRFFNAAVPDGQQAVALSGFLTHELAGGAFPVRAGDVIRLSFFAGRRNDAFGDGPGVFNVLLQEFGGAGTILTQSFQTATDADPTTTDLNLTAGLFSDSAFTVDLVVPITGAGNLAVAFLFVSGDEVALDSVSAVQFIPEPSTGLLLSFGLFGLVSRRRRRG